MCERNVAVCGSNSRPTVRIIGSQIENVGQRHRDPGKTSVKALSVPGEQRQAAALFRSQNPVAVKLQLVLPVFPLRQLFYGRALRRLDESGFGMRGRHFLPFIV